MLGFTPSKYRDGLNSKADLCSVLFADDRAGLFLMLVLLFKSADQCFETMKMNTTNPQLTVNDTANTLELR